MDISLVPSIPTDRTFLRHLHQSTMRPQVEAIWGWDDAVQAGFFNTYIAAGNISIISWHGQMVGAVQVHDQPAAVFLSQLEIDPAFQGKGIGTWIIEHLKQQVAEKGKPLRLQVLKINTGANRLYQRLGFRQTGTTETHFLMEWLASTSNSDPPTAT